MKRSAAYVISGALALGSLPVAGPASAQTPSDLRDLVGARGSSADNVLTSRGYTYVKTIGAAGFWWNASSRACVSVAVDNGRVESIQSTGAGDCGQSADKKSSDNSAAVAVAALAAVGLAAAIASHHKNTDNRHNNPDYNQDYERGYNDAMYGAQYANNDSEPYHSGYLAGEAERQNRRAANTAFVRGAPRAAQSACVHRADRAWDIPDGSSVPVSVYNYGQDNYEITVASGHRRGRCSVTGQGRVTDFNPN